MTALLLGAGRMKGGSALWTPLADADLLEWFDPRVLSDGAQASGATWTGSKAGVVLTADVGGGGTKASNSLESAYAGVTFLGPASGNDAGWSGTSIGPIPVGSDPCQIYILVNLTATADIGVPCQIVGSTGQRRLIKNANESMSVHDNTIGITGTAGEITGTQVLVGEWNATTENGWVNNAALTGNPGAITLATGTATRFRYGAGGASGTYTNEVTGVLSHCCITNVKAQSAREAFVRNLILFGAGLAI